MDKKDYEEMRGLLIEMRTTNDERVNKIDTETKQYYEKLNNRLDEIELKTQRPPMTGDIVNETARDPELKAAFLAACRKGYGDISPEQRKILRRAEPSPEIKNMLVSDDTTGGYFAPEDFQADIIKAIVLISPIWQFANVRTTSRESVAVGKRTATPKAQWGNEQTPLTKTATAYGKESIIANRLTALAKVQLQDLEDPAFNLEVQLNEDVSEEFERAQGEKFVSGTGVSPYPEGLLTNPLIPVDYSGDSALLTGDGLVKSYHNLKSGYGPNARWFWNRQTLGAVRLLKDQVGRYLLQPGLAQGNPNTVLDSPYAEIPDMPAVATGTSPILFGDMKKAYWIVQRVGMSTQRLDQLYAEEDAIGFKFRMRVGGGVVLPEAMRKITVHA